MKIDRFALIDDYDYLARYWVVLNKKVNEEEIQEAIDTYRNEDNDEWIYTSIMDMLDGEFGVKEYFYIDNVFYI